MIDRKPNDGRAQRFVRTESDLLDIGGDRAFLSPSTFFFSRPNSRKTDFGVSSLCNISAVVYNIAPS